MLLMVRKDIRGGICHSISIYQYAKANNKYMEKIMIKVKNRHIFNTGM